MSASDLARRLAERAEAVCRHYLPAGRREGAYWRVGDVEGAPGGSLYIRLRPPKSGKWSDAATGEHGDLLDLIAANQDLATLAEALAEARQFLALSPPPSPPGLQATPGSPDAARKLFAAGRPLKGTPAERYLYRRGLPAAAAARWLRSHPHCYYRGADRDEVWPALLAAATDLQGCVQGVQRIWLTKGGQKAPVPDPRRALGHLLGHAVRFGAAADVLAAGEGLESVLSVREILPGLPVAAALSAAHLGALVLPSGLRRLYIALDDDEAGRRAAERLGGRARDAGVEMVRLSPRLGDFNEDLQRLGRIGLARTVRRQVRPEDWLRFATSRA